MGVPRGILGDAQPMRIEPSYFLPIWMKLKIPYQCYLAGSYSSGEIAAVCMNYTNNLAMKIIFWTMVRLCLQRPAKVIFMEERRPYFGYI